MSLAKENFLNDLHFRAKNTDFLVKTEQKSIKKEEIRKKVYLLPTSGLEPTIFELWPTNATTALTCTVTQDKFTCKVYELRVNKTKQRLNNFFHNFSISFGP